MEHRENIFRKLSYLIMILFILESLSAGIYFIVLQQPYEYILSFAGILFLVLPFLLYRLLHMRPVYQFNVMVYIFVFIAYTLGLIFHWYSKVPYYDKFAHTLSGVFVTPIAMGFFYVLKPVRKIEPQDFPTLPVFSLALSISVAEIWEFSEYFISFIFLTDPQNVVATGVNDTMQDMLVCTLGSVLVMIPLYFYFKKGKKDFIMGTFETFFTHLTEQNKDK